MNEITVMSDRDFEMALQRPQRGLSGFHVVVFWFSRSLSFTAKRTDLRSGKTIMQQYVQPRGKVPFIVRAIWRNRKAAMCYCISSKVSHPCFLHSIH
jgi:hypothetical protein